MRNHRPWRKLGILLVTPFSLLLLNCGKNIAGGDPDALDVQLTVSLENLDTPVIGQDVHLFASGETFPCCKVFAGAARPKVITMRRNEEANFQAGRNGTILKTTTCKCTSACPATGTTPVGSPKVTWSQNTQVLACVGW